AREPAYSAAHGLSSRARLHAIFYIRLLREWLWLQGAAGIIQNLVADIRELPLGAVVFLAHDLQRRAQPLDFGPCLAIILPPSFVSAMQPLDLGGGLTFFRCWFAVGPSAQSLQDVAHGFGSNLSRADL